MLSLVTSRYLLMAFLIEDGQLTKPVHEMTIAGNFFDLLQFDCRNWK